MAIMTYIDGGLMALVPVGTEARRDRRVEVTPGHFEPREGLMRPVAVADHTVHLPPAGKGRTGSLPAPERPHVRMAYNQYLGTWFLGTFFLVFLSGSVPTQSGRDEGRPRERIGRIGSRPSGNCGRSVAG
jgi:hypothetical protein